MPRLPKVDHIHATPWLSRRKSTASDDSQSQKSTGSNRSLGDVTQMIGDFSQKDAVNTRRSDRTSHLSSALKGTRSNADGVRASRSSSSPEPAAPLAWKLGNVYPIIPGRLHFTCAAPRSQQSRLMRSSSSMVVINSELPKQYFSFCQDFGPNNLAIVLRFCEYLSARMAAVDSSSVQLVFRASDEERIRTNSAFLLAAFLVLEKRYTPEQAIAPFEAIRPYPFRGYRDATNAPVTFEISILDCLRGLVKAMSCGWFEPLSFNLKEYEFWDTPTNGDMHQICPKFIAFKGPVDALIDQGEYIHSPEHYIRPFKKKGVTAVVRLSESDAYDPKVFKSNGIHHYELYFDDCTTPSEAQVRDFINIVDREEGVVAVHCKAGLGRTGTLIGAYLMARHGFRAREAIAWMRLCRPGCVIGPQQQFLVALEEQLLGSAAAAAPHSLSGLGPGLPKREKLHWRLSPSSRTSSAGSARTAGTPPAAADLADQVSKAMLVRAQARAASDAKLPSRTESSVRQSWPVKKGTQSGRLVSLNPRTPSH